MSNLPLEVVEMLGQTIAKVVPITIVLAAGILGADAFLGLQSRERPGGASVNSSPTFVTGSSFHYSRACFGSGCLCSAPA